MPAVFNACGFSACLPFWQPHQEEEWATAPLAAELGGHAAISNTGKLWLKHARTLAFDLDHNLLYGWELAERALDLLPNHLYPSCATAIRA